MQPSSQASACTLTLSAPLADHLEIPLGQAPRPAEALLPQDQHVPGLQETPQANPTCRPQLPPVPLLARAGGPSNPGPELGPTYAHLSLSAAPCPISPEWKCWSDATPLPCTSVRAPVRVNPRLGPIPREQDETKHAEDSHQHPWCCLRQTTDLRATALLSLHQPESSSRQRSCSPPWDPSSARPPSPRTLHRTSQPQGGSWGSWTGAAGPRRSLAWTHPDTRAGGYIGFSSDARPFSEPGERRTRARAPRQARKYSPTVAPVN